MSDPDVTEKPDTPQSKGGRGRAERLSREERADIARKAAAARWSPRAVTVSDPRRVPTAERRGELLIGEISLDCFHLDDGRRVFHKRGIAKALGLKSSGGNAFKKMISREGVGSALGEELRAKIDNPIVFNPLALDPGNGAKRTFGHGYEATVLIDICEALIQAQRNNELAPSQAFLAIQAEVIVRSSAKLGIIALIDEATGYISDLRKEEYRKLFQAFVQEELRQWEQEFPDRFFDMIYRLYGLKRKNPKSFKHPGFFGKFIRKYVYHPLANSNGAILKDLDEKNPVVYVGGGRRHKFFQFLTDEIGLPAFRQHLWQVVGIGNSVPDKTAFERAFRRAFPEPNTQLDLDLGSNDPDA
ncbi:MAG TPA: P63C domain-containing protein [Thermoanaerobaculia bacterium]|nr:P63C domain-containing protein [Thermoanaerobaculia bacterium]